MDDHNILAERAVADEQAFTELYHLYIDQIYAFVMRRIGHHETTEDLVADIFRKVFLHLSDYNSRKGSFRTWLYHITNMTLIDYYRVYRHPNKPVPVPLDDAVDHAAGERLPHEIMVLENRELINQSLLHLSTYDQRVVQLKFFSECSNTEIAELLGVTPNNVSVIVHRALKKLKAIIEPNLQ